MNEAQSILFILLFVGISAGLVSSAILFTALKKKYPKYYKLIGAPTAFPNGYNPNSDPIARGLSAQGFVLKLLVKGVPANFPKDRKLQKIALFMRYDLIGLLILFVLLALLTVKYSSL